MSSYLMVLAKSLSPDLYLHWAHVVAIGRIVEINGQP
jgi:hypothetical protein